MSVMINLTATRHMTLHAVEVDICRRRSTNINDNNYNDKDPESVITTTAAEVQSQELTPSPNACRFWVHDISRPISNQLRVRRGPATLGMLFLQRCCCTGGLHRRQAPGPDVHRSATWPRPHCGSVALQR